MLTTTGYKLGKEEQGDDLFLENPLLLLEPSRGKTRAAEEASVDSQRLHMADLG